MKYMALLVVAVAVEALLFPWTFSWVAPHITILLGIGMFGMGMTLSLQDFRDIFKHPRDVLIGVMAQFTIMPTLAWLLAKGFNLQPELAVGVILVGTCPGGTSSNVMTYLARGDVALSVSMSLATTILAPIVTPFLTWYLAGTWIDIQIGAMMLSICQVVILPIAIGLFLNHFFADKIKPLSNIFPIVSVISILLLAGGVVSVNAERIMETATLVIMIVICHNVAGYALGFIIARVFSMDYSKIKAVSIEVGMQNSGLATSLALMHFTQAAAIPAAIFSVWHNISGSIIANYFAGRNNN